MVSRRITRFLLVLAVILLAAMPVAARPAVAARNSITITDGNYVAITSSDGSSAAGQGVTDHGDVFNFTATNDANGIGGSMTFTVPDPTNPAAAVTLQGQVTCFSVNGNAATLGIQVGNASIPSLDGNGFWVAVQVSLSFDSLGDAMTSVQLGNTNPWIRRSPEHGACTLPVSANKQVTSGAVAISTE
jgi:hypothetical protein